MADLNFSLNLITKVLGQSAVDKLNKELDKTTKKASKKVSGGLFESIKKQAKSAETSINKTVGKINKGLGGLGVALGATSLAIGFKELITIASDAEETLNKFKVVFQDVSEDASKASKDLAKNFGLSGSEAKKLLSDTGDLLTGFGFAGDKALDLSTQVQELAVDLASFTNFSGGAAGASAALTKALLGERESVKALGISIQEADVKKEVARLKTQGLTFETERQAKAQATLNIALSQSKNALGDFARSSGSFANQSRILSASLRDIAEFFGERILPAVNGFLRLFNSLPNAFKKATVGATGLSAVLLSLTVALGTLKAAIVATGIGALVVAVGLLINEIFKARDLTNSWANAFKLLGKRAELFILEMRQKIEKTDFAAIFDKIRAAIVNAFVKAWNFLKSGFGTFLDFLGLTGKKKDVEIEITANTENIEEKIKKVKAEIESLKTGKVQASSTNKTSTPTGNTDIFDTIGEKTEELENKLSGEDSFITRVKDRLVQNVGEIGASFEDVAANGLSEFANGLQTAFFQFAEGTKSAKKAFGEFARSFITQIGKMIFQAAILKSIKGVAGGLFKAEGGLIQSFNTGGTVRNFVPGGKINGPGSGTSDSILARVSNGEFVIRAKATESLNKKFGEGFLNRLNQFDRRPFQVAPQFNSGGIIKAIKGANFSPPKFMDGGLVNSATPTTRPTPTNIAVKIDNNGQPAQIESASGQYEGEQFVVNVVLGELQKNGSLAQGIQNTFGLNRNGGI